MGLFGYGEREDVLECSGRAPGHCWKIFSGTSLDIDPTATGPQRGDQWLESKLLSLAYVPRFSLVFDQELN